MSAVTTATLPATIREIMSRHVVTVGADDTLRDAIGVLDAEGISGAPVIAGGEVVGVLSTTDVLTFEAATPGVPTQDDTRGQEPAVGADEPLKDETHPVSAYFTDIWDNAGAEVMERMRTTSSPEWDVLAEHVVSEVMSPGVRSVQAHASLADAAAYMLDERIHRALVLDGDRLVGVVTASDFLRAIAGREPRKA
jgi:CBS domain-containing protein